MTAETDAWIRRIKAILAKAESTDSPAEAESLSAKAAALMQKYSITMAVVDAARSKQEREKPATAKFSFKGESYARRKMSLLNVVAKAHRCEALRAGDRTVVTSDGSVRQYRDTLYVFGFQSDLDLAAMLYWSLLVQAQRALAQAVVPSWDSARSFRNSWWIAYINRLIERLAEAKAAAEKEAPGTELVLADRSLAVKEHKASQFPGGVRKARAGRVTSVAGMRQGREAADRADLGETRIDARQAAAALA